MSVDKVIVPPATIGMVGGGQLGRMSALAARAVLEECIEFTGEYSVIVARNPSGATDTYSLCRNIHRERSRGCLRSGSL